MFRSTKLYPSTVRGSSATSPPREGQEAGSRRQEAREQQAEDERIKRRRQQEDWQPSKGSGKGQGKGKDKDTFLPVPFPQIGKNTTVHSGEHSGEPICFSFALGCCPDAKAGQRCPKGWHACPE